MSAGPDAGAPRVIAVVPDLFFATRIAATARACAVPLELVEPARAVARCAEAAPALVLLDLHASGAVALVQALASDPRTSRIPVVGFFSHVEIALRDQALAAGLAAALPRSAFTERLPDLLVRGWTAARGPAQAPRGPA